MVMGRELFDCLIYELRYISAYMIPSMMEIPHSSGPSFAKGPMVLSIVASTCYRIRSKIRRHPRIDIPANVCFDMQLRLSYVEYLITTRPIYWLESGKSTGRYILFVLPKGA